MPGCDSVLCPAQTIRINILALASNQISTNSEMKTYGLKQVFLPLLMVWLANICVVLAEDHPLLNDPEFPDDIDKRNGAYFDAKYICI